MLNDGDPGNPATDHDHVELADGDFVNQSPLGHSSHLTTPFSQDG
jgi:hypothetical protein